MKSSVYLSTLLLMAPAVLSAPTQDLEERQSSAGTVTVDLSAPRGSPAWLASGIIYGIPDTPNQIPDKFYTDMKFNYGRAGGSQMGAPARGWVYGATEFQNRFASALSNYKTIRKYNGKMQLIFNDLWGADGQANIAMPGDNGNWSSYDAFLNALIKAINDNNMATALDLELWNEPDLGTVYWQRSQDQYLQMWGRGYSRMRKAFPQLKIVGPSSSGAPALNNAWLDKFYSFIAQNGSVPDQCIWHMERDPNNADDDLQTNIPGHNALLQKYGLPSQPIVVNEYAVKGEQQPAGSAWWISRLERYNIIGLRGNWALQGELHDYLAGLLGKPGAGTSSYQNTAAGYWPNGEYNVYKYYGTMTGTRYSTTGSEDRRFDIYATVATGSNKLKMLCGSRLVDGTYNVQVKNMSALGYPTSGNITIHTYHYDYTGGEFGNVPAATDRGTYTHAYTGNTLNFPVGAQAQRAFSFEFV